MFNFIIILLVVICDQGSKFLVRTYLPVHKVQEVFSGLNWYLTYNHGISFSIIGNLGEVGKNIILIVNIIITTMLLWFLYKYQHTFCRRIALALIIGGAIGNIIDRCYLHAVIDFIDVYCKNYHWYTFNIADAAITCGVALFVIDDFKNAKGR